MAEPKIAGKIGTAFDVGHLGNGNKTEINFGVGFLPSLTLNLHSEFKSGLAEQDTFKGSILKPADLLIRGIYRDQMTATFIKALNLSYKPVDVLTIGFGYKDVGRDITSNGAKVVGAGDISDMARNPTMPFFERPYHIYPGSTLSAWLEYADKESIATWRLFGSAGNGKPSQGLLGLQQKAFKDDPKTDDLDESALEPILPVDQDPYSTGGFYTFGGDVGVKVSPEVLLGMGANLSLRTFNDADAKKKFDKKAVNDDPVYNPSLWFGMELFKRVSLWTDLSWISDPESENKDSFSWRAGARGKVLEGPWGNFALQFGAMGITAGQGAKSVDGALVYLDEETKETQIIGPEGPVTVPLASGGGERKGHAVAGGVLVNWNAFKCGKLVFSFSGGGIQDDKMGDDYKAFVDFRTQLSYEF